MKIANEEGAYIALHMSAEEADRLMFALSSCESPAANEYLQALEKYFGYKVVEAKEGEVPALAHGEYADPNVKVVTLYVMTPMGYTAEIPKWEEY